MKRHISQNFVSFSGYSVHKSHYGRIVLAFVAACLSVFAQSCTKPTEPVAVVRLDRVLADYAHLDDIQQMQVADSLAPELDAMFAVLGDNIVTTGMLDAWSRGKVVEVFQPDVDSVYPDTRSLEHQIGAILSRAAADSLGLPQLEFVTVTWGNPRPIVRIDSIVLIALNHFLGSDYPGYSSWPMYVRSEKTPSQLPYSLAGVLAATQHPMTVSDPTLLTWMLYEGALVEARMRLVPDAKLEMALGYTPEQLKFADEHCTEMWQEMAIRRLVYDTDPVTIDRFIAQAPSSPLMQGTAPGRIGRYMGYRIVRAYLKKHPGMSLSQLLSPEFYGSAQTLIDSGFN